MERERSYFGERERENPTPSSRAIGLKRPAKVCADVLVCSYLSASLHGGSRLCTVQIWLVQVSASICSALVLKHARTLQEPQSPSTLSAGLTHDVVRMRRVSCEALPDEGLPVGMAGTTGG